MRPGSYEVEDPEDYALDDLHEAAAFAAGVGISGLGHSLADVSGWPQKPSHSRNTTTAPPIEDEFEQRSAIEMHQANELRMRIERMRDTSEATARGVSLIGLQWCRENGIDWRAMFA